MDLPAALVVRATADSAIAAIVADRVSWATRPQGEAPPALVFRAQGGSEDLLLSEDSEFFESSVNADCYGRTHLEAMTLARAVRAAFKEPANIEGFEFMDSEILLPIDFTQEEPNGPVYLAGLFMTVRHGTES